MQASPPMKGLQGLKTHSHPYEPTKTSDEESKNQDTSLIKRVLNEKNRKHVLDIQEADMQRLEMVSKIKERQKQSEGSGSIKSEDVGYLTEEVGDVDPMDLAQINLEFEADVLNAEADAFWCLQHLMENIKDNFTEHQPGVNEIMKQMKDLINTADAEILRHLDSIDINFMDFAYRWVSCYLTREFSIFQVIRLWDTYLAEEDGFKNFHCYVCAALMLFFGDELKQMNFDQALLFLLNLPTLQWTDEELDTLVAKAFELSHAIGANNH